MDETILKLTELKSELGIAADDVSQDDELTTILATLAPYLYDQTGVWFGSAKTETEYHDYDSVVFTSNAPVIDVLEVRTGYDSNHDSASLTLLDKQSYRWNRLGRIMLNRSYDLTTNREDYDEVYLKYTHGVQAVPQTVKMAARIFASNLYNDRQNDNQTVTSVQAGSYKETYQPSQQEQNLLAPYVRQRL